MTVNETSPFGDNPTIGGERATAVQHRANDLASSESGVASHGNNLTISGGAMLVVGLAGGAAVAMLPGVLSAFIASGEVVSSQSPSLGASELTGITLSMLGSGFLLAKLDRWYVALFSVVAIVLGQLISAWPHSIDILVVTRLCTGVAEGVLIATVTAAIAGTPSPERLFALWFSMCLIVSAAFCAALPLLLSLGQIKGAMFALAGVAAIAALALPWFPRGAPINSAAPAKTQRSGADHDKAVPAILALSASLMLFTAIGAVWPLVPQIGHSNRNEITTITAALAAASFAAVISGLFTSWLGLRVGRSIPVIVGTLGLSVAMLSLLVPGAIIFAFAAVSFMVWWIADSTYYLGVVAALDRSGRLATVTFAVQFLGLTVGQFLAAALLQGGYSYHQLTIAGALLTLLALLQIMLAMRSGVSHARA